MSKHEQDGREIDLSAYIEGRLTGEDRAAAERTLGSDQEGKEVLDLAKRVLQDAGEAGEVPADLLRKAKQLYPRQPNLFDIVISLAGKAITVLSASADTKVVAPAFAGAVRTAAAGAFPVVVMTKVFDHASVDVHIERLPGSACGFTVQATDTKGGVPLQAARAELVSGWRELASSPLERGIAQFEDVRKGHYEVIIRKQDAVIVRMSVKIVD